MNHTVFPCVMQGGLAFGKQETLAVRRTGFSCRLKSMKRENSAQLIQRRMAELALTQEGLAKKIGVKYQTVQQWISGETAPRAENRRPLAAALQIEIVALLEAALLTGEQRAAYRLLVRDQRASGESEFNGVDRRWHRETIAEERRQQHVPLLVIDEGRRSLKGGKVKKKGPK